MDKPNRLIVRFFFASSREHAVQSALGWYLEIDFLPQSWTQVAHVMRGCTNVVILKEIDLDPTWFYNRYREVATYDGTTLCINCTDYDVAYELLNTIVREHARYQNPTPFPGGMPSTTS